MTVTPIDWLVGRILMEGVQVCCLGAGSRSTQLVHLLQQTHVKLISFVDERSVAFMALGIAKATQRPVLVVTTSGTAVSNLCPAITEAAHSHINLIALTADRPSDMAGTSANQTIDQQGIFHDALAEVQWEAGRDVCDECDRAFDLMARQGGPVHVNVRLKDPVTHPLTEWAHLPPPSDPNVVEQPMGTPLPDLSDATRGLVCIGQLEPWVNLDRIRQVMDHLAWPVVVDGSHAQLKSHPSAFHGADAFCNAYKPTAFDRILYMGGRWISKPMSTFLLADHVLHWSEGAKPVVNVMNHHQGSYKGLLSLSAQAHNMPVDGLNKALALATQDAITAQPASDLGFIKSALNQMAAPFDFFIANSLPIRLVDAMHVAHVRQVHVNRGASGIDGNIATIMGLCMAETDVPLLAIVGDLAAVYDLNSFLLMPKVRRPVSILIVNNGGGNIFSRLPSVANRPDFNDMFKLAHQWPLADMIAAMGVNASRIDHPSALALNFKRQVIECLSLGGGVFRE
jgi:2-succinyl-5-enolpyruvyl-6-hydroxy-3-cyclohexene-1-carboxylate synthase